MRYVLSLVSGCEPTEFVRDISIGVLRTHAMLISFCASTATTWETLWACRLLLEGMLSRLVVGPCLCQCQFLGRQP